MKRVCQKCGSIHLKNERCGKRIDPRIRSVKPVEDYESKWGKFLRSKAWGRKRNHILKRDGGICICCHQKYGKVTNARQVHHIDKINDDNKLDDYNLISLCTVCHKRIDDDVNYYDCKSYIDSLEDDSFILW